MNENELAYVLPKAFAIRGFLLPKDLLRKLTYITSLAGLVDSLKNTAYSHYVSTIQQVSGITLERAFKQNLIDVEKKLIMHTTREIRDFLFSFFKRHELDNLKVAVKAKILKIPAEEYVDRINFDVEAFLGNRVYFAELIAATDIRGVRKSLAELGYEIDLDYMWSVGKEKPGFIDLLFDKIFYNDLVEGLSKLSERDRGIAEDTFSPRIDRYNVMLLLRSRHMGISLKKAYDFLVLCEECLPPEVLKRISEAENVGTIHKILCETKYSDWFRRVEKISTIAEVEKAFLKLHYERAERLFVGYPFNIGPLIGAILLKEREVNNLIAIAYGIEKGLPPRLVLPEII
ncbi:MAG: hypothetical protein DRJ51_00250 [Thermoprotei archaeon]|nr:MAG: hypothetical protein DRJ51_00250 [Thermoprotei archaeon]RLE82945.1 MAG: hypothetical protein DRJ36_00125 [Thermoprotei archaeon]RLF03078.1 MAG: hypothetical protein DRJ59_01805 [Thermoprotei archaeon]